jgi:hypothetical protein
VVEEVMVALDDESQQLAFIIHWKGGTHTRFTMPKPVSGVGRKTSMEDLEVIRELAVRYGDDEIARVLTKLGRRTATGKRWNESRVRATRKSHQIAGQRRSQSDPEVLSLARAAIRGTRGTDFSPIVRYVEGRRHLPVIELRRAA